MKKKGRLQGGLSVFLEPPLFKRGKKRVSGTQFLLPLENMHADFEVSQVKDMLREYS